MNNLVTTNSYPHLSSPTSVIKQNWDTSIPPLVTISCITYNHKDYIKEAIEGFLAQETTFKIELLIHDDASTDGTGEIVKVYANKYPDIIFPIIQSSNQFSKDLKIRNTFHYPIAKGKYIALCEGDDYWTDPLKLQKQVEFLEGNEEYGLVHGECHFYYEDTRKWEYNANKNLSNSLIIVSKKELFYRLVDADYKIRTATVLFRRDLLKKRPPNAKSFLMGDTPMWLDFSQLTKFKYFDEVFAVYRILSNSASRSKNKKRQYRFNLSMAEMRVYFCYKYNYPVNEKLKKRYNKALLTYLLFDSKFPPLYPLFEPNAVQQFKFKYSKYSILNIFFKITWTFYRLMNLLANKLSIL